MFHNRMICLLAAILVCAKHAVATSSDPYIPLTPDVGETTNATNAAVNGSAPSNNYICCNKNSRPLYFDCMLAIFKLPEKHDPGSFHQGKPDDIFRLPKEVSAGSCTARVNIVPGQTDVTSWNNLRFLATSTDGLCHSGQGNLGKSGGTITGGDDGLIRIDLFKLGTPDLQVGSNDCVTPGVTSDSS